jgi:hypothetical protein
MMVSLAELAAMPDIYAVDGARQVQKADKEPLKTRWDDSHKKI